MDIKSSEFYRFGRLQRYKRNGENKYNYAEEGILKKCLPKILFKGNPILVTFIQLIDVRLVMLLKYIDRLKNFKDFMKY